MLKDNGKWSRHCNQHCTIRDAYRTSNTAYQRTDKMLVPRIYPHRFPHNMTGLPLSRRMNKREYPSVSSFIAICSASCKLTTTQGVNLGLRAPSIGCYGHSPCYCFATAGLSYCSSAVISVSASATSCDL